MANKYLISGGNGDYDDSSNWSTTSGGASGASKPLTTDDIIIDANSSNANISVLTPNLCKSIMCSGYAGILTIDSVLSVTGTTNKGNITLSAGSTVTGSGTLSKVSTGTTGMITSNGVVIDCNLDFAPTVTSITILTGLCVVNKNLTFSTPLSLITTTINGDINVGGDFTNNHKMILIGGRVIQFINSTPTTISANFPTSGIGGGAWIFNKSGGGTFSISDLYFSSSINIVYTAGVSNITGTLYALGGLSLNTNGMKWNVINCNSASSLAFSSNFQAVTITKTNGSLAFASNFPFNVDNFIYIGGSQLRFKSLITHTINNSIIISVPKMLTLTANSKVNINLGENAFMKIYNCQLTDINATNKTLRVVGEVVDPSRNTNCFTLNSNINPYSKTN